MSACAWAHATVIERQPARQHSKLPVECRRSKARCGRIGTREKTVSPWGRFSRSTARATRLGSNCTSLSVVPGRRRGRVGGRRHDGRVRTRYRWSFWCAACANGWREVPLIFTGTTVWDGYGGGIARLRLSRAARNGFKAQSRAWGERAGNADIGEVAWRGPDLQACRDANLTKIREVLALGGRTAGHALEPWKPIVE